MSELVVVQSTGVGVLPRSSDWTQWDERERALAMTLGLAIERNGRVETADRGTIEVFLSQCERTQLDPVARQIYCIKRGNKWGVQISIDGARLVAERSGEYEGQTAAQWTADGEKWVDVWLAETPPAAARVGVYRRGFRDPLFAVARFASYVVMNDEWVDRQKTGNKVLSPMWAKMPDVMIAKVAEMLALRKAFPQDLSGLYSTEEMEQAGGAPAPRSSQPAVAAAPSSSEYPGLDPRVEAVIDAQGNIERADDGTLLSTNIPDSELHGSDVVDAEVVEEPAFDAKAWELRVEGAGTTEALRAVWDAAESEQVLGFLVLDGSTALGDAILARREQLGGA